MPPITEMMSLVATSELPVTIACTRAGPPPPSFGPGSSVSPCLANRPNASAMPLKDSEGSGVGSSSVALIVVGVPAVCAQLTAGAAAMAAAAPAKTRKAAGRRIGAVTIDISTSLIRLFLRNGPVPWARSASPSRSGRDHTLFYKHPLYIQTTATFHAAGLPHDASRVAWARARQSLQLLRARAIATAVL